MHVDFLNLLNKIQKFPSKEKRRSKFSGIPSSAWASVQQRVVNSKIIAVLAGQNKKVSNSLPSQNKALIYLVILILINVCLFSKNWEYGKVYAWADITLDELNINNAISKYTYMWHSYRGLGMEFSNYNGLIVDVLIKKLIMFITLNNISLTNALYNGMLFVLPCVSIYLLTTELFKKDKFNNETAFFAALLYQISLGNIIPSFHPIFMQEWVQFSAPLLLYAILRYIRNPSHGSLIVYILACLISIGNFVNVSYVIPIYTLGVLVILLFCKKPLKMTVLLKLLFIYIVITLPYLYATYWFFYTYKTVPDQSYLALYTQQMVDLTLSTLSHSQVFNAVRLIGSVNWGDLAPWTNNAEYKYPFYVYYTQFIGLAVSFAPIVFITYITITKRKEIIKDYASKILIFLVLISTFLLKGGEPPLGGFFADFIRTSIGSIIRTPYPKLIFAVSLTYTLTIAYFMYKFNVLASTKNKLIFVTILVLYAIPIFKGQVFQKRGFFRYEPDRIRMYAYLNNQKAQFRIIQIPAISYMSNYSNGYLGGNLDYVALNKPLLVYAFLGPNSYAEAYTKDLLTQVRFRSSSSGSESLAFESSKIYKPNYCDYAINDEALNAFVHKLQLSSTKYIMFDRAYKGNESYPLTICDRTKYEMLIKALIKSNYITSIQTFGQNITLYELKNYKPLVFIDTYEKDDSVHILESIPGFYRIKFSDNYEKDINIVLAESFDDAWKVYKENNANIPNNWIFSRIRNILYLFKQPLPINHSIAYNYANMWRTQDINANDTYVIYYLPQALFDFSLIISGMFVVGLFLYINVRKIIKLIKSKNA